MLQETLELVADILMTIIGGLLILLSLAINFHVAFPGSIHIIFFTLGALFMWRGFTRSP